MKSPGSQHFFTPFQTKLMSRVSGLYCSLARMESSLPLLPTGGSGLGQDLWELLVSQFSLPGSQSWSFSGRYGLPELPISCLRHLGGYVIRAEGVGPWDVGRYQGSTAGLSAASTQQCDLAFACDSSAWQIPQVCHVANTPRWVSSSVHRPCMLGTLCHVTHCHFVLRIQASSNVFKP